jgi:hypothetical protein
MILQLAVSHIFHLPNVHLFVYSVSFPPIPISLSKNIILLGICFFAGFHITPKPAPEKTKP